MKKFKITFVVRVNKQNAITTITFAAANKKIAGFVVEREFQDKLIKVIDIQELWVIYSNLHIL